MLAELARLLLAFWAGGAFCTASVIAALTRWEGVDDYTPSPLGFVWLVVMWPWFAAAALFGRE